MAKLLNYQPQSYYSVTATTAYANGVMGKIPSEHYERYITAVTLNSVNLTSADVTAQWSGPQTQTIQVIFYVGSQFSNSAVLDYTQLGDQNRAEYLIPLLLPRETEFYIFWSLLLPASATKVGAVVQMEAA